MRCSQGEVATDSIRGLQKESAIGKSGNGGKETGQGGIGRRGNTRWY